MPVFPKRVKRDRVRLPLPMLPCPPPSSQGSTADPGEAEDHTILPCRCTSVHCATSLWGYKHCIKIVFFGELIATSLSITSDGNQRTRTRSKTTFSGAEATSEIDCWPRSVASPEGHERANLQFETHQWCVSNAQA